MPVSVSFHNILLVITVIITVGGPVVDIETIDGRVVYRSVLLRDKQIRLENTPNVKYTLLTEEKYVSTFLFPEPSPSISE